MTAAFVRFLRITGLACVMLLAPGLIAGLIAGPITGPLIGPMVGETAMAQSRNLFKSQPVVTLPASLTETAWLLQGIDGADLPSFSRPPIFTFTTKGRFSGRAVCNTVNAQVLSAETAEAPGDHGIRALRIGSVASSRVACTGSGGEIEAAFFLALGETAGYQLSPDGVALAFIDRIGSERLRFRANDN